MISFEWMYSIENSQLALLSPLWPTWCSPYHRFSKFFLEGKGRRLKAVGPLSGTRYLGSSRGNCWRAYSSWGPNSRGGARERKRERRWGRRAGGGIGRGRYWRRQRWARAWDDGCGRGGTRPRLMSGEYLNRDCEAFPRFRWRLVSSAPVQWHSHGANGRAGVRAKPHDLENWRIRVIGLKQPIIDATLFSASGKDLLVSASALTINGGGPCSLQFSFAAHTNHWRIQVRTWLNSSERYQRRLTYTCHKLLSQITDYRRALMPIHILRTKKYGDNGIITS